MESGLAGERVKLAQNTTDIPDDDIEDMLRRLEEPDDLPVTVKLKVGR
jgi:hypothetical protein